LLLSSRQKATRPSRT